MCNEPNDTYKQHEHKCCEVSEQTISGRKRQTEVKKQKAVGIEPLNL